MTIIDVTPKAEDGGPFYWTREESDYWNSLTTDNLKVWLKRPALWGRRMMEKKFGHSPDDCWKIHNSYGELVGTDEHAFSLEVHQSLFTDEAQDIAEWTKRLAVKMSNRKVNQSVSQHHVDTLLRCIQVLKASHTIINAEQCTCLDCDAVDEAVKEITEGHEALCEAIMAFSIDPIAGLKQKKRPGMLDRLKWWIK